MKQECMIIFQQAKCTRESGGVVGEIQTGCSWGRGGGGGLSFTFKWRLCHVKNDCLMQVLFCCCCPARSATSSIQSSCFHSNMSGRYRRVSTHLAFHLFSLFSFRFSVSRTIAILKISNFGHFLQFWRGLGVNHGEVGVNQGVWDVEKEMAISESPLCGPPKWVSWVLLANPYEIS